MDEITMLQTVLAKSKIKICQLMEIIAQLASFHYSIGPSLAEIDSCQSEYLQLDKIGNLKQLK